MVGIVLNVIYFLYLNKKDVQEQNKKSTSESRI